MTTFEQAVTAVLARLPSGVVVTYGEVAAEAGYPRAARAVGNLLAGSDGLPWWRVVRADGRLVPGEEARQATLLALEGITTTGGRVTARHRRSAPRRGP
jgi:methylated-DNA-protein-cysteine methyltransferase-like protein